MHRVSVFGTVRDYPQKGHDRFYRDQKRSFAGVFDGAGGDELSDAAITRLPYVLPRYDDVRRLSERDFMAGVAQVLDNLPEARLRRSTAALATVALNDGYDRITYLNMGDSSIYFYDHDKDILTRVAHTPESYETVGTRRYISTKDFLGNGRDHESLKRLIGSTFVQSTVRWSVVGFSDGVQGDSGEGIPTPTLRTILRDAKPESVPDDILDNTPEYDDASVFVMTNVTS